MRLTFLIVLLFGFAFTAVGQEPLKRDRDEGQDQKKLLARIAALEKRVEQLESMLRRQQNANAPITRPNPYQLDPPKTPAPPTGVIPPSPYRPSQPYQQPQVVPPVPQQRWTAPPPPSQLPPSQYRQSPALPVPESPTPKGWQKFEFNGQTFYIIPVDQVPASAGLRR